MCKTHIKEWIFLKEKRKLIIKGAILDKHQLENYLEKIASDHILTAKSDMSTYPVPRLKENFFVIKEVYKLLNEQIKQEIPIHPAGEWILDNFYVIEKIAKNIAKELSPKKYEEFLGLANGRYKGFSRIYVLASEMVAYTDGRINSENLEFMLQAYQTKKTLNMNEIWNIGIFIQLALIENIRDICESIYMSQVQKYKVQNILSKYFPEAQKKTRAIQLSKIGFVKTSQMRNAFVEYMSYKLKKYGSKAYPYLNILEDEVAKTGNDISDIIKKEHFDIAVKKVSVGNCITTLKAISRINFLEIFEKINRVEDILKQDPANQYEKMDEDTKAYYRNAIQEISKKTKISEIYIAKKCLELCLNAQEKNNDGKGIPQKEEHIGYYLISTGKPKLLEKLYNKAGTTWQNSDSVRLYICGVWGSSFIFSLIISGLFYSFFAKNGQAYVQPKAAALSVLLFFIAIVPVQNIISKTVQYVLSKIVRPKLIPKLDFQNGVPKEFCTMVVIPTILKSGKKTEELMDKLEVYYLANRSDNLYFTLLGDCSSGSKEKEAFDEEVIEAGTHKAKALNEKYGKNIFNFVYRKRTWNSQEECYMGWERKRGFLDQFNEYLLGHIENPFKINTIQSLDQQERKQIKIKYIITLDSDTDLTLNSALKLIGAMAHILNRPTLNSTSDLVISGHALMQPTVGIGLKESRASVFTQIYAGEGGTDSYTSAISNLYQDNFDEGIYTGKGIYDLNVFSKVLNNEIKENTVLSHDLLEGSYLRCALASDIMLMDGYPSNYLSFRSRLYRWIRGDFQVTPWLKGKIENKNGKAKQNPLNLLSKYKIFSNIVRSKHEAFVLLLLIFSFWVSCILKINCIRTCTAGNSIYGNAICFGFGKLCNKQKRWGY